MMRGRTTDPLVDRRGLAARPARLLLARRVGRLHVELHRARPVLPRGHRAHAAHVRPQPAPREPGGRLVPQRPAADRRAAAASPTTSTARSPASSPSASPTAPPSRPASARSRTRSWRRSPTTATSASTPSCCRDGVVDLVEAGVVNGIRKDLNRTKTVGTFALGTERLYDFLHENTAVELWPRALRQRPAADQPRARLRVDQRHALGRLPRPVRVRDDRRAVLLVVGRPERLRPRRRCTPRAARGSSCCTPPPSSGRVAHRAAARAGRRGHDAQEHRRQGRHRVRRRRAPRPQRSASAPRT